MIPGCAQGQTGGFGIMIGGDVFCRSLCLPSDNKKTSARQARITESIHRCLAGWLYPLQNRKEFKDAF